MKQPLKLSFIDIISPPEPSPQPQDHPVSGNCGINAHGKVSGSVDTLIEVWGWVNNADNATAGGFHNLDWWVTGARHAYVGCTNTFTVEIKYQMEGQIYTQNRSREFYGKGDTASCYSSGCDQAELLRRAGAPITRTMPRYYRLWVDVSHSGAPQNLLTSSGLLRPNNVYLAFDASASTPSMMTWRDVNVPDAHGRWTLHVWSLRRRLAAELVFQRVSETEVPPPFVVRCARFRCQRRNTFSSDPATVTPTAPAVVYVEPA